MDLAALLALLAEIASEHTADVVGLEDPDVGVRGARAKEGLDAFRAYIDSGQVVVPDELKAAAKSVREIFDAAGAEAAVRYQLVSDTKDEVEALLDGITPAEPVAEGDAPAEEDVIDVDSAEVDVTDPELITAARRPAPTIVRPSAAAVAAAAPESIAPVPAAPATFLTASAGELITHESSSPKLDAPGNAVATEASRFNIAEAVALTASRAYDNAGFSTQPMSYNAGWFPGTNYAGTLGKIDGDAAADLLDEAGRNLQSLTAGAGAEPAEHSYNFCGTAVSAGMPIWDSRIRWNTMRSKWNIRNRHSLTLYEASNPSSATNTDGKNIHFDNADPTGTGHWSLANDVDSAAAKSACATPGTTTETQFELAAFYRCVKLTNLEVMTDPEKVDQFLRLGATAWVRALERDLIDEITTLPGAIYIQQSAGQYGAGNAASREILPVIREQITELEHQEGWSSTGYELITMDWVKGLIQNDLFRRPGYSNKGETYTNEYLRGELDVDVIFTDVGSAGRRTGWQWAEAPRLANLGAYTASPRNITFNPHRRFPNDMPYILAPKGAIQAVDRGAIQMGVSQWTDGFGSVIRDSTTAASNQFAVWWEIAKAVMSTGCPFIVGIITDLQDTGTEVAATAPTDVNRTAGQTPNLLSDTRRNATGVTGITFVQV